MCKSVVAGVDIGGTHITAALIDMDNQQVIAHTWQRWHINTQAPAQEVLAAWSSAIHKCCKTHDQPITSIGIAMPGPFDYVKGISLIQNQNKFDALYGVNVKQALSENLLIPVENIAMANDAECFLKGEVFGGVAKGYKKAMGLTLGTGLGSAIAINNQVVDADLWRSPFKQGMAEDYLSNRWFVKRFFELTGQTVGNVKELVTLHHNNGAVQQVFDEFGENLGQFLVPQLTENDIPLVVLGGNITQAYPLFSAALESIVKEKEIEIKQTTLGENATLMGAASYCAGTYQAVTLAEKEQKAF